MLGALRADGLVSVPGGFELRVGLPWIRSLPLDCLREVAVSIDGEPVGGLRLTPADDSGWWHLQDRLTLSADHPLSAGRHAVAMDFRALVPHLIGGPAGPLVLPFHLDAELELDAPADAGLPAGWLLAANSFNWTPEVIRAERTALQIVAGIAAAGVASVVEVEAGQVWPSFPAPADAEVDALREALALVGGRVGIVGASIDDYAGDGRRRSEDERLAFLLPQLYAAKRVGGTGIRLPMGQAGRALLERLLPTMHELDLTVFEEFQGQQAPSDPRAAAAMTVVAELADPHVRLLCDISLLMPALPTTYLEALRRGGVAAELVDRLEQEWLEPATMDAVRAALGSGAVPPGVHTLFMDLLIRFGRSSAADLKPVLDLIGGYHLKFWDLDDADGRISTPIRDLGALLAGRDFTGTLTSEWGGHEWLDLDPTTMTRDHLKLARTALAGL